MEQRRRLVLFLSAAILTAPLYFQGHAPCRQHGDVAFSRYTSSGVTVRVRGTSAPGIYIFPAGFTAADVIKLTVPGRNSVKADASIMSAPMRSGDAVEVAGKSPECLAVSIMRMNAGDLMLLGIPLSPDQMECADWQFLPGIGARMAKKIVEDRQQNGDYRTIESLRRVPGIGVKKFNLIRKYFSH